MIKNYPTLKNLVPLFFLLFGLGAFSQTFSDSTPGGTETFTVPCGVTSITVEAWGGGGGGQRAEGNPSAGGGGSGGGYVKATIAVIAGNGYSYFVGTGGSGNSGGNGTSSWFISSPTLNAVGGAGAGAAIIGNSSWGNGANAFTTGNVGGVIVNSYGGSGANAISTYSGGGGSSGGSGLPASNNAIGINGGAAPTDGYAGANGRNNRNPGINGNIGSGGSGGRATNGNDQNGGSGGNGQIRITYTSSFPTYCSPTFTTRVDPITNVTFAGINNTTANTTGGSDLESFCDIGTVVKGTTHQISLKGNTVGNNNDYFTVYIDWNQNGTFGDIPNEIYNIGIITNSTGIDNITLVGDISVPTDALLGNTRMRVIKRFNGYSTSACQTGPGYGQAEDYSINVTATLDTYCTSYGNNVDGFNTGIRSVNFNTLNNASPIEDNDYSDFTAISTSLTKGLSYNLTVNVNTDGNWTNYTYAWIDWNQDGDFLDAGESYNLGTATNVSNGATSLSPLSILIPLTANGGSTRMRVSTKYFSAPIPCGAGFDGEVEDYTINIICPITTWTGNTSRDWNVPSNWSGGVVPAICSNVLIPFPLAIGREFPIISVGDPEGLVRDIEIQPGASVTIEGVIDILTGIGTGNALTIAGDLILNGIIDLNGESQLIQSTGSTFSGTGTIEIDQQGTGNSFRYNYWSSPVNSNLARDKYTIGAVLKNGTNPVTPITFGASHTFADGNVTLPIQLSTYWMYVLRNSGFGYAAWARVGETGEVSVGEGYTMKGSNTATDLQSYTFVGKPNNGDISLTLNAGFNYLVGNPYPSAIDADQFLYDNGPFLLDGSPSGTASITGVIYFWEHYGGDTHNLAGYQAGYATYNYSGGAPATSPSSVSSVVASGVIKKTPEQNIAVGQAFFVVGDSDGGDIKFNNGQRVFEKESTGSSVFMKNSNTKAKTENSSRVDLRPKFRIGFDAPKISHRQLLLTIDERATPAADWGFDAAIYEIFSDDMYWMLNNKKYVIQAFNEAGLNSEVPLGIQLSKTGIVTVKIDALENVDDDTTIYLKDKLTGESFNMMKKPVQLNLTAGKYTDRFVLLFKTQKLMAEDVKAEILIPAATQTIIEGIHVFMNNAAGELQIKNNSTEEITGVALINAVGQTIKTWNSNFNLRTISLPVSTATGIYLVQINTKTGNTVKKISVE